MSETPQSKEPINPRTHMAIVLASKGLIKKCLADDEAKGESPFLNVPVDPSITRPTADTPRKLIYELYPKVDPDWKGRFFAVSGGESISNFTISAPVDGSDPDQMVYVHASLNATAVMSDTRMYMSPHKSVAIPLAEAMPGLTENPELTPADNVVLREELLSEQEAQDLLTDLSDILAMQGPAT